MIIFFYGLLALAASFFFRAVYIVLFWSDSKQGAADVCLVIAFVLAVILSLAVVLANP
jgi:hypothetical protein